MFAHFYHLSASQVIFKKKVQYLNVLNDKDIIGFEMGNIYNISTFKVELFYCSESINWIFADSDMHNITT